MADFYDEMALVAIEMLSPTSQGGLGQGRIELIRTTPGTPGANPWDPVEPVTETELLKGAVRGVDKRLVGTNVGDAVILASDRQAICATPKMDYTAGDTLSVDGKPVHIISVENIPAAGTRVAVKFLIRG